MAASQARPTEESVVRAIDAIYAAALAPAHWTAALEQLRSMFGLSFAASVIRNADRTQVDGIAAGVDPDDYQRFLNTYYRSNVFGPSDQAWCVGQIIRLPEIVPHRVFQRTRVYQEFWRPHDMYEALRFAVSRDENGVHHTVNLIRPRSAAPFDAADIALGRALMPHLQHASEVARRLRHADLLAAAALSALDTVRHPVLLLGDDGRVLHSNGAGEALLAKADGLGACNGVLYAATPAWTSRLQATLARAADSSGAPRAGALRLPRSGGGLPLALLAMPFRKEAHWSLARGPTILVCITDPDAVSALPGRQMAELFGLTGSEAAVAGDLLAGLELREIAARRGRSVNTVRTHLARLMAKTNVNRQSELMRLLASLPRLSDPI